MFHVVFCLSLDFAIFRPPISVSTKKNVFQVIKGQDYGKAADLCHGSRTIRNGSNLGPFFQEIGYKLFWLKPVE